MPGLGGIIKDIASGAGKGLLDGVKGIIGEFVTDPTAKLAAEVKLKELEASHEEAMANIDAKVEDTYAKELESVNETIREEAKSEHWLQWSWRPLIGFLFIAVVLNNYIIMPYLKKYGLAPIEIPSELMTAIMVILGVASAGRSAMQFQKEKNKAS